jgi:flavin reductase (DIM6/NTAB) family NADH-FMN oxidoreductase RutF
VPGPVLAGAYLQLECTLDRVVEGFGENGLVIGKIVAARVHEGSVRHRELEDERLIEESPLLVYLAPGQFARVDESHSFPLPHGFHR